MKKLLAGLLAVMMLAGFSGCSAEGGAGSSAVPEGGASSETPAEREKITFVLDWTPNTNHTGVYVAKELGYYEEAGMEIDIVQPPEDGATALVGTGKAEFGVDFQDYLAPALLPDTAVPVTAVAAIIQHNTSGIVSLKEKGVTSPKMLEGKTYATWELPVEQAIMKLVMERDGGDFSKLNMVPSTVTDVVSALQTNIDAVWIYYAWDGIATKVKGLDTNYWEFRDIDPVLDFYTPVIVANNDFLKNKPDVAKAFLAATAKGYEYAIEHPEEAAEILCNADTTLDKDIVLESQKWLAGKYIEDASRWGEIDASRWDGFYAWLYEENLIEQEIPAGTGFTNDYLPE